ncbi:MAG: HD-GYP domain-containing protein [Zoogloeaceae bacterium]|nr:HD-GYP domain-containing protein [Zoogloeaceae bacterium]
MTADAAKDHRIPVDQLRVGMYVYLDLGWMAHPFSFSNFKIKSDDQLATIRSLGISSVRWDPSRSDSPVAELLTGNSREVKPSNEPPESDSGEPQGDGESAKKLRSADKQSTEIGVVALRQEQLARVEQAYVDAVKVVKGINKSIYSRPEATLAATRKFIEGMVADLLEAPELAIQVMAEKPGAEDLYLHALNVAVLAMILAREVKLPAEIVRVLGLAAVFHDIGLNEVPSTILNKTEPLTAAERQFREAHCQYGHELGLKLGLPTVVCNVILQHHEQFDGSGYPKKLKGEQIDLMARLLGVVNGYDNLCNPARLADALTPHEALSLMYAQHRNRYDPRFLQAFVRTLGVYPPGTVVSLSNDRIGLVIGVNTARPLRPLLVVHDPAVSRRQAPLLDLEAHPEANISRAIRPQLLPADVYDYLSPRKRVSYFFDAQSGVAG